MPPHILIIDDNKSILTALQMLVQTEFEQVTTLENPNSLISTLQQNRIDVVLLDMNFNAGVNTGNEGIYWLNEIKKYDPDISVIMITAYGDVELAVRAVKEGAFNFILKPWDNHKLLATIHSAIQLRKSKQKNQHLTQELSMPAYEIIGKSQAMKEVMSIVEKVAKTDANILITGENGTGKELIAREIHRLSNRKNEIFLSVDMGSISESLFESELFGHKKGAFTDAVEDRTGKFETAHKGSLFLDEIGNLPMALQAKMLRVLQERSITRLGDNKAIPIDIRLISATNRNLQEMVAGKQFREDLLFRINTINIHLPPLREREEDILLLANYFLQKYARKYGKAVPKLSGKSQKALMMYNWPGNIRELQHQMEKAVILSDGQIIHPDVFALNQTPGSPEKWNKMTLEEMEKSMIEQCIRHENGNMSAVAKKLGITRQTLYNKLKKYGL